MIEFVTDAMPANWALRAPLAKISRDLKAKTPA